MIARSPAPGADPVRTASFHRRHGLPVAAFFLSILRHRELVAAMAGTGEVFIMRDKPRSIFLRYTVLLAVTAAMVRTATVLAMAELAAAVAAFSTPAN